MLFFQVQVTGRENGAAKKYLQLCTVPLPCGMNSLNASSLVSWFPLTWDVYVPQLDNVLLAGPRDAVQLVDFGWSRMNSGDACCGATLSGTPEYVAPEVSCCSNTSLPPHACSASRCCRAAVPEVCVKGVTPAPAIVDAHRLIRDDLADLLCFCQVLQRQPGAGPQPTDVWAAGVVLWALVGGGFAFLVGHFDYRLANS